MTKAVVSLLFATWVAGTAKLATCFTGLVSPSPSFLLSTTRHVPLQQRLAQEQPSSSRQQQQYRSSTAATTSTTRRFLFEKAFESEGPLGKGITIGKIQVALNSPDRSEDSIFGLLEDNSRFGGDSNYDLACMAEEICIALMRKSSDWTAACSESKWFSENDAGKAESQFNEWANREAAKFEKDYRPGPDSAAKGGGPTLVVVSMVIELQGDQTKFDGAGFSISKTKDVLSSIASDVMVEDGDCVNAVEVFWTPGDRDEVLTSRDLIVDFPELITL